MRRGLVADYYTTKEFADEARAPEATVRYWRHIDYGPRGFKLGRRVLYEAEEVRSWIEQVRHEQTEKAG
jgi:hypothetical protein